MTSATSPRGLRELLRALDRWPPCAQGGQPSAQDPVPCATAARWPGPRPTRGSSRPDRLTSSLRPLQTHLLLLRATRHAASPTPLVNLSPVRTSA